MKKEFKSTDSKVSCNSIIPNSVTLLSVKGAERPNILTITLIGMLSSHPPVLGVGMRKARFSFDLIKEAGDFVINIPTADMVEAVKLCGKRSGRTSDKFKELGLTPMEPTCISSPLIKECPINLECKVTKIMELGSHDFIMAEILTAHVDESVLVPDKETFDPSKLKLLSYFPMVDEYWTSGEKV
jgi:flavin reductase (DIM6/NTAB) family NADH-FMN oxidoreductase RutF